MTNTNQHGPYSPGYEPTAAELAQKADFETKRLRVFKVALTPSGGDYGEKDVFLAFHAENEWSYPISVATISPAVGECADWVEWIETVTALRRQGIAAELVQGIEKYYGRELSATGATPEGDAFCDYLERVSKEG